MFGVDNGVTDGRNDVMAKRKKGSHQEGPGGLDETGRRDERTRAKRAQRIRSEKKRRKQFNELISELGALLPDGQSRMDKPTVLQRTLHFFSSHHELNVEQEINEPPPPWKPAFLSNDNFTQLILEAMDCFVIVVMSSGEISFVSESVTSLLGYLPSELLRQNLFDFVPEHEQAELRCLFQADLSHVQEGPPEAPQAGAPNERRFELCCHLQRGEALAHCAAGQPPPPAASPRLDGEAPTYERVKLSGFLRQHLHDEQAEVAAGPCLSEELSATAEPATTPGEPATTPWEPATTPGEPATTPGVPATTPGVPATTPGVPATTPGVPATTPGVPATTPGVPGDPPRSPPCLVASVHLLTSQFIKELSSLEEAGAEFTSRHSLEWKFLFLDHRAPPIIGYMPFEVLGTSGYDYYHVDDLESITQCHRDLKQSGKGKSCHYRFLTKGQQWIWLQTKYFISFHQWNSKPEFVVCTHTVLSYSEVLAKRRNILEFGELSSELLSPGAAEVNPGMCSSKAVETSTRDSGQGHLSAQARPLPGPSRSSLQRETKSKPRSKKRAKKYSITGGRRDSSAETPSTIRGSQSQQETAHPVTAQQVAEQQVVQGWTAKEQPPAMDSTVSCAMASRFHCGGDAGALRTAGVGLEPSLQAQSISVSQPAGMSLSLNQLMSQQPSSQPASQTVVQNVGQPIGQTVCQQHIGPPWQQQLVVSPNVGQPGRQALGQSSSQTIDQRLGQVHCNPLSQPPAQHLLTRQPLGASLAVSQTPMLQELLIPSTGALTAAGGSTATSSWMLDLASLQAAESLDTCVGAGDASHASHGVAQQQSAMQRLKEQLEQRTHVLQTVILQQQEELRHIQQQLAMALSEQSTSRAPSVADNPVLGARRSSAMLLPHPTTPESPGVRGPGLPTVECSTTQPQWHMHGQPHQVVTTLSGTPILVSASIMMPSFTTFSQQPLMQQQQQHHQHHQHQQHQQQQHQQQQHHQHQQHQQQQHQQQHQQQQHQQQHQQQQHQQHQIIDQQSQAQQSCAQNKGQHLRVQAQRRAEGHLQPTLLMPTMLQIQQQQQQQHQQQQQQHQQQHQQHHQHQQHQQQHQQHQQQHQQQQQQRQQCRRSSSEKHQPPSPRHQQQQQHQQEHTLRSPNVQYHRSTSAEPQQRTHQQHQQPQQQQLLSQDRLLWLASGQQDSQGYLHGTYHAPHAVGGVAGRQHLLHARSSGRQQPQPPVDRVQRQHPGGQTQQQQQQQSPR